MFFKKDESKLWSNVRYDEKMRKISYTLFDFEQFIGAICQCVPIFLSRKSRRVEDLADTEKTMELRYIVDLYLPLESIFSIHVTCYSTYYEHMLGVSLLPTDYPHTKEKTSQTRPSWILQNQVKDKAIKCIKIDYYHLYPMYRNLHTN